MHDGRIPSRWKDVKALPLIIEGLQKRGYKFVTVSELFRLTRSPSKPLILIGRNRTVGLKLRFR